MNSAEFSSTCRICLQDDATYLIFDESSAEGSILLQLNKCFMEKIEDLDGYPRSICSSCKMTLDLLCEFIDKYRESSEILRESLAKVKTEVDDSFIENDHDFINDDDFAWDSKEYVEIKVENNNETLSCASEILEKLKVPGLKITKVKSKKVTNKAESKTTVKKNRSGKRKCVKSQKIKHKKLSKKRETVTERVKKLIETEEKEEKSKEKLPLLCDICGAVFSAKYKLTRHKEGRHSDTKFTCSICSKQYNSEFYLRLHTQTVHSNKKFKCDQCSKEYKNKKILRSHIIVVHNKERKRKKTFICQFCDKTYKCALSLTIHERSVHTGLRPAVCKVCDKAFFHDVYLKEHMRLHTGELPFKCPFCDRGYTQRGNMKSHLRQHKMSELNETIMSKMRPSYMKCLKNC